MQHLDYRVTVSMDEHAQAKLRPIEVPQGYLSNAKEISEGMLTNIKRVNGGSWLVGINRKTRHGDDSLDHSLWVRPKIAAVDLGSQRCSETTPREIVMVIGTITIGNIPSVDLRWTSFTDSSFDTDERQRHQ